MSTTTRRTLQDRSQFSVGKKKYPSRRTATSILACMFDEHSESSAHEHGQPATTTQPRKTEPLHLALFGDLSDRQFIVVDLTFGGEAAKVSTDIVRCPMRTTRYDMASDGLKASTSSTIGSEMYPIYWTKPYTESTCGFDFITGSSSDSDAKERSYQPRKPRILKRSSSLDSCKKKTETAGLSTHYSELNRSTVKVTKYDYRGEYESSGDDEPEGRPHYALLAYVRRDSSEVNPLKPARRRKRQDFDAQRRTIESVYTEERKVELQFEEARGKLESPLKPASRQAKGKKVIEKPENRREARRLAMAYLKADTNMLMNDIRSSFPPDLTGRVTRSECFAFASGGFGDVYRGSLNMTGRSIQVAIKTYKKYLQCHEHVDKKMKRFRREITVWLKLSHPNVLPLFGTMRDPSLHPEIPAMVCPWVENGALSTYLEKNHGLTVSRRLSLVDDVAHGLQYLHSQHVVHGDLSGSNVLIYTDGSACISDFGLSTLLTHIGGSTFATTRQNKGTVRWMAPELLDLDDSQMPTMQSDVYSFGSIMLQILTGCVPYHYLARDAQVIRAIATGKKPRRPDPTAVTDNGWKFMEWCWSSADAAESRPSGDQIVDFVGKELAEVMVLESEGRET